jgi:hypothetical protein
LAYFATLRDIFLVAKSEITTDLPRRAALLAQSDFFPQRFIFKKIIFAEITASEEVAHGTAINLESKKLCCTCPFHPKPCIHVLALYALFEQEGEAIFSPVGELPQWADLLLKGQINSRIRTGTSPETKAATKAKTRFERLERATNGMDDLEAWLLDTARRGLATVASEDPRWWESIASRMADASMTGLSRTLRLLGQIPSSSSDWAEKTAAVLAGCYLAVRAFRKRDSFPETLLFDLQNFIGINTKKEEVLTSGERVNDIWAVVGQIEEALENNLKARRTWFLGGKTGRYAFLLDFKFGSDDFPPGFAPGEIRQGILAFYPSAFPQRTLAPDNLVFVPKKIEKLPGFADFDTFAQAYAVAVAAQPFLQIFPAAFSEVIPQARGGRFFLIDKNEKSLPLNVAENDGWRLLALSGGHPAGVFGEWDGSAFKPLSAAAEGRFVAINH